MNTLTPTRHGNWHVVDGRLVDRDAEPIAAEVVAESATPSLPANAAPSTTVVATVPPRRSSPSKE